MPEVSSMSLTNLANRILFCRNRWDRIKIRNQLTSQFKIQTEWLSAPPLLPSLVKPPIKLDPGPSGQCQIMLLIRKGDPIFIGINAPWPEIKQQEKIFFASTVGDERWIGIALVISGGFLRWI